MSSDRSENVSTKSSSIEKELETQQTKGESILFGWKKWVMLFVVSASFVVVGVTFSIPPAFYPTEAEDRGISPSEYGFVFGISNLAGAIFSVVFAIVGQRMGAKMLFVSGSIIQSLFGGVLFGVLGYVTSGTWFLILSYVFRFVFGVADSSTFVSSLSIMIGLWPENFATVFSAIQTCFGFGYAVGPYIGSVLYEAGGFELPFFIFGALGLALAFASAIVVPNIKGPKIGIDKSKVEEEQRDDEKEEKVLTISKIIMTPSIGLPILDNLLWMWGFGFTESMLEPFAKEEAGMSQDQVGLSFLILGTVYMVFAPVVGLLCDHIPQINPILYSIASDVVGFAVFTFMGPATFVDLEPSSTLIFSSMALFGVGNALIQLSTISRAQKAVVNCGYPDDINTYLILTGSWTSAFYFGNFLGPTIGGFLVDQYDFQRALYLYLSIYVLLFVMDCTQLILSLFKRSNKGGK